MKRSLLPQNCNVYKANLHMHTEVSDGTGTPAEVKQAYMAQGYSVVAFTDHEVLVPHKDLTDENFVAITSYEKSINRPANTDHFDSIVVAHLNFFAKEEDNTACPVLNPDTVWGNAKAYITEEMKRFRYEATYSTEGLNDVIEKANKAGFLVSLNHPAWSLQNYEDYGGLKGLWGVECFNTGCVLGGYPDTMQPIDDLLRKGERVFPLATDDAHQLHDRFGGYVNIFAKQLTYSAIMQALERGDFYASTGPEFKSITLDGDTLTVECSPVRHVEFRTSRRNNRRAWWSDDGSLLNGATFDISHFTSQVKEEGIEQSSYFYITLTDAEGKQAHTRAFFMDELLKG